MTARPDPYAILDEPRSRWHRRPVLLGALYYVSTHANDDSRVPAPIGGNQPQQR